MSQSNKHEHIPFIELFILHEPKTISGRKPAERRQINKHTYSFIVCLGCDKKPRHRFLLLCPLQLCKQEDRKSW